MSELIVGGMSAANVLIALGLVVGAVLLAKFLSFYIKRNLKDRLDRYTLGIVLKAVTYTIVAVAFIAALSRLGINPSGLIVAGGITGLVLGFASQNIVSNLVSGVFLIIERPIKVGQQVYVNNIAGFVEDISILSTYIRTYDGLYVRIPNEKVFTNTISNYVANVARRFEYVVGIRYSDDAERAIEAVRRLIDEHPIALKHPEPRVFVDKLDESSVNLVVRIWAPATIWYELKNEMLWKIKKTLEGEGIQIPFPQRVVWRAGGDAPPPDAGGVREKAGAGP